MNISKVIEQLGYKPNEVKVYLAALTVVEATVSEIALKAKLPLSSTQVAMNKLHKDGLANFYNRKHRKYWIAEQPEKLLKILKNKEEDLSSALKDIKLNKLKLGNKPTVDVFIGIEEIRTIHDYIIEKKRNISAIIPLEAWTASVGQDNIDDFINARMKHFLNMRMLVSKTPNSLKLKERDSRELRHTKFLSRNILIEDALFIFGDCVAIITLNESQPTGIVIEDQTTTRTMMAFFEDLWEKS